MSIPRILLFKLNFQWELSRVNIAQGNWQTYCMCYIMLEWVNPDARFKPLYRYRHRTPLLSAGALTNKFPPAETCALFLKFTYTPYVRASSIQTIPFLLNTKDDFSSWFKQAYGQSHPKVPKGELLQWSDAFPDTVSLQAWELFPFRGSESL